ncbi:uncharacterized protein LOC144646480 [Oculina patagonica]
MANKANSPARVSIIFFLCLLELMDMTVSAKKVKNLENIHCKTHETVVPVDPNDHGYFPYFVKLHRCAGSANTVSPKVQHCVVKSYDELNIQVYSRSTNFRRATITMKNHTSCAHECVASPADCDLTVQDWSNDLCACKCRYPNGPPKELACKDGFRWNSHKCKCECDRAPDPCPGMVWSNDICGCRCPDSVVNDCTQMKMGIDVDCKCVDVQRAFRDHKTVQSRTHMFITLLIGQAVLIILLICALVHWVRKRNQQSSAHSALDRLDSCKTNDDISPPYLEVAVESDSTDSIDGAKESSDNDSCTAPLSPKPRVTDI